MCVQQISIKHAAYLYELCAGVGLIPSFQRNKKCASVHLNQYKYLLNPDLFLKTCWLTSQFIKFPMNARNNIHSHWKWKYFNTFHLSSMSKNKVLFMTQHCVCRRISSHSSHSIPVPDQCAFSVTRSLIPLRWGMWIVHSVTSLSNQIIELIVEVFTILFENNYIKFVSFIVHIR